MHNSSRIIYIGERFQTQSRTALNSNKESVRREQTAYGAALESLANERRKTCIPAEFTQYCKTWASVQGSIWAEDLADDRRLHRVVRFRAVQKTIAEIANTIAPARLKGKVKRLVFWGDGGGKAIKGCASTLSKKIIRALACLTAVVITPEAYTSMMCPGVRCSKLQHVGAISALTKLQHLSLKGCSRIKVPPDLEPLTQLWWLDLCGCISLATLPSLRHLEPQHLELNIENCSSLQSVFEHLPTHMDLKSLSLRGCTHFLTTAAELNANTTVDALLDSATLLATLGFTCITNRYKVIAFL
jgi:hypothetical protein